MQKFLAGIIDAAIDKILTRIDIEKRLDDLRQDAKQELDELRDKAFAELEETRDKALAMISDDLPKVGAAIAQAAVETLFKDTHVDEAATKASDVITDILNRLPFGLGK